MIRGDKQEKLDYRSLLPVNMTSVFLNIKGDQGYLLSHDGLTEFAQTNGKARGGTYNERFEKHYRVSGDTFEEIGSDGTVTALGVTSGDGIVSFSNSFNTQAILTDGKLFYWDNATLQQVTDPELGFPIDITWFKGIYVMTDGESLSHTDINNEFSISPLKYSSSEFASDKILAVANDGRDQIVAFNRFSTEYFYFDASVPTGTSVLVSLTRAANRIGIVGTYCHALIDGMFFILGGRKEESPSVHILNAGQETHIASREIDKIIAEYTETELKDVVLESRVVDRDKFLIIHLPNETLIYNHTIGMKVGPESAWSYVKSGVDTDEPWRAKFGVFDPRATKWIYGDMLENKLGYLNQEVASQYGEQVECITYTPIMNGMETLSLNWFEINTIPGFVTTDMTCSHSFSQNGVTFEQEYSTLISEKNNYNTRFRVRDIYYVRYEFSMKFRFVSLNKMAFSSLRVDVS